jgi:S-(hydroxymethyl)glutathione dehydrogenase/alcohol dehydrogenase
VIEEVGLRVHGVRPGDEVVLSWAPSCGECADCHAGRPARCHALNRAIAAGTLPDGTTGLSRDGETVYRGTATGCLAERVVVPERLALATGASVPLQEAALLGCAALTGVGAALFAARVEPGAAVVVVGAGGVGQFVVQGCRIAGAEVIVVADPIEGRRDQAVGLGATHAVHPDELRETVKSVAPAGADVAFDAVGDPDTTMLAFRNAASGSTTVIVGLPAAGRRLDHDPSDMFRKEKRLAGTLYGSADPSVALPLLLEHVAAGRLELTSMLGPVFPLDDVNDAIEASLAGAPGRVLVAP